MPRHESKLPGWALSGWPVGIDALAGPAKPALSDARKPKGDQRDGAQPLIDLEAVTLIFGTVLMEGEELDSNVLRPRRVPPAILGAKTACSAA